MHGARARRQMRISIERIAASAAAIDGSGSIIAVNEAWRRFARANGLRDEACGEGTSYLTVCEAPSARETEGPAVARAVRRVLAGSDEVFRSGYACHAPDRARWFRAEIASLRRAGTPGALVAHFPVDEATVRRETAEAERRHIARELHDTTAQNLACALLDLERVAREERERAGEVGPALAEAIELCRRSLDEVRCLAYELRPPGFRPGRLVPSLRRLVSTFTRRTGLAVMLLASPLALDADLSDDTAEALYRTAEESLHNTRRHAMARHVSLRLDRSGGGFRLVVTDDGRGIAPDAEMGKGLTDVRERLESCGGRVVIAPARKGTVLQATVPARGGNDALDRHRG